MIAAGIDGGLITLIIFAVIGVINWIMQKSQVAEPKEDRQLTDEDLKRRRKFLEALGLPPDQAAPPPMPQVSRRKPTPRPPPPLPTVRRRVEEMPSLDEADAPQTPAGLIHFDELEVPTVPDFTTVSSRISAIPTEKQEAQPEVDAYRTKATEAPGAALARLLKSKDTAKQAMILREILGSPKGLPSDNSLPTFR